MNKDLLVEIFVPTTTRPDPNWGVIGTGYPVAKDRILTARHVLCPPSRDWNRPIEVRWHHRKDCVWIRLEDESILWAGGDAWDAAVFCLPLPTDSGPRGALSAARPVPGDWESEGFAAVGLRKDGGRTATPMGGRVHRSAKTAPFFALDLNVSPEDRKLLTGASGSPVFMDWTLVGVVVECPPHLNAQRLWAVPICRLLEIPEFCAAIGLESHSASYLTLMAQVVLALSASSEAMGALERYLPVPADTLANRQSEAWAKRLTEAILELSLEQVIPALAKAHRQLCTLSKQRDAGALADAGNAILPAVIDRADVQRVQADMVDGDIVLVRFPAATRSIAEILMAAVDERKAFFRKPPSPQATADSHYSIGLPPTAGLDPDYSRWAENLEKSLAQKFVAQEIDPFLDDEQRAEDIRNALAFEAESQRTCYVVCQFKKPEDRKNAEQTFKKLRERYPALVLLDLSTKGERILKERALFRPFAEILKGTGEAEAWTT